MFLSRNECNGSRKSLCRPVLCICVNINSKLVTLFFSLFKTYSFSRRGSPRFWDPPKMLGTPIWPHMRVPGPRLKNPSAIPARVIKFVKMNVCILMNKCKYYGDLRLNLFFILFSSTYIHHLCPSILHPGFLKSQEPIQEHLLETVT